MSAAHITLLALAGLALVALLDFARFARARGYRLTPTAMVLYRRVTA